MYIVACVIICSSMIRLWQKIKENNAFYGKRNDRIYDDYFPPSEIITMTWSTIIWENVLNTPTLTHSKTIIQLSSKDKINKINEKC